MHDFDHTPGRTPTAHQYCMYKDNDAAGYSVTGWRARRVVERLALKSRAWSYVINKSIHIRDESIPVSVNS